MSTDDGKLTPPRFTSFEWNTFLSDDGGGPGDDQPEDPFKPMLLPDSDEIWTSRTPSTTILAKRTRDCLSAPGATDEASGRKQLRRRKKPKGMPKRPLSAYNIFFQRERVKLMEGPTKKVGFKEMGKIIGERWRNLPESELASLKEVADNDRERYRLDMQAYNDGKRKQAEESKDHHSMNSSKETPSSAQPIETDLRYENERTGAPLDAKRCYGIGSHPTELPHQNSSLHRWTYQGGAVESNGNPQPWNGENRHTPPYEHYHAQYQGSRPPRSSLPLYPAETPSMNAGDSANIFQVPPGWQVKLQDPDGVLRSYRVEYTAVTMSKEEARQFLQRGGTPDNA